MKYDPFWMKYRWEFMRRDNEFRKAYDDLIAESLLDSIYCEDGKVDIFEVVEDELILGLPLVTMHDDMTCNEFWPDQDEDPEQAAKNNPFSVLAKLKTLN